MSVQQMYTFICMYMYVAVVIETKLENESLNVFSFAFCAGLPRMTEALPVTDQLKLRVQMVVHFGRHRKNLRQIDYMAAAVH